MFTVTLLLLFGAAAALDSHTAPPAYAYYPVESYPLEEATVRDRCTVGARRRFDYTQCSAYEECVAHGKARKWEQKKCAVSYAFNDGNGNCELNEKCAIVQEEKCSIRFFRLSCSELLVCSPHNGAYVRTNCDDGFRNEFHSGCVADARCTTTKYQNETCTEGQARPTANCRTYSICEGGVWKREKCKNEGRWTEYCSECDPEYKPRECKEGDSRKMNRTEPFEGYGIDTTELVDCAHYQLCEQGRWNVVKCADGTGYNPSFKRCTPSRLHDLECNPPVTAPRCEEGSRIVPPHSCDRFLQCDRGEWIQMACPIDTRFDAKHNHCVPGKCEGHGGKAQDYGRRGRPHHHDSDSSSSSEEWDVEAFQQQPIMIPPRFPSPPRHRLNGAAEPFPTSQVALPSHRPGYLGQQPGPIPVDSHHHHPHHPQQPYPPPRPQPYPVVPVHPPHRPQYPSPSYPAQPSYPSPSYPSAPSYPSVPSDPSYPPARPSQPIYEEGHQPPRLPGLICEGDFKVADAFDAAFYYDCVQGYLKRKACRSGSRFDPQRSKCLKDYTWQPDFICYDNQVMPTAYCGEYRICRDNEWLSGICPHDWPFINGQCDKRRTCTEIATPPPPPTPTCAPGSVRPDNTNPLGYLECNYYYQWEKRNCQNGGVFDKRLSRCVYPSPSYPPSPPNPSQPEYRPACYEGELRKDEQYCTKYEICHAGRFEQRYCPYGHGFDGYHCQLGYKCGGESGVEGTCQESAGLNGYLPDRTDCAFFYQCASGKWIRMPCAPGTHYSPTKGVCDHIGNVPGCGWSGPRPTHY